MIVVGSDRPAGPAAITGPIGRAGRIGRDEIAERAGEVVGQRPARRVATIQAALPPLREQGHGHILTVSSIGGLTSFPTAGMYTATRHAVEAVSQSVAGEVRPFGIQMTSIEPGSFRTTFRESSSRAEAMAMYDPVREAVMKGFDPSHSGDPYATPDALLVVVDSAEPPLRLIWATMSCRPSRRPMRAASPSGKVAHRQRPSAGLTPWLRGDRTP